VKFAGKNFIGGHFPLQEKMVSSQSIQLRGALVIIFPKVAFRFAAYFQLRQARVTIIKVALNVPIFENFIASSKVS